MAKGRQLALQAVHYLRRQVSFSEGASAVVTVGTLPAGALIINGHAYVSTAFNAGTNNNLNVGTVAAPTSLASAVSMSTAGRKDYNGIATATNLLTTGDTDIIATLGLTGTAATAGSVIVTLTYLVNNDK